MQDTLQQLRELDEAMMPFGMTVGFTIERVAAGEAVVAMECLPHLHNLFGYTHGGAIFSIADTAIGLAHVATLEPGQTATTVESRIVFMRPVLSGFLRATATSLKRGRTLSFYDCDITDEAGKLMARVSATMMTLDEDRSQGRNEMHGAEQLLAPGAE